MADYFAALAARTLRPELNVQPRQRVRWEEVAAPLPGALSATEKKKTADGARPGVSDGGEPPRRSRRTSIAEDTPAESEQALPRPRQERGKRTGAGDQEDAKAKTVSTPHPTVRALQPTVQVRFEPVAARSGDAPGKSPAVAGDPAQSKARASGIERPRPPTTRVSTRERESTAEPAIRIHIGRVDVRAVTAAVPGSSPAAPRDGKRGLMSLDEYVQKRDRGVS